MSWRFSRRLLVLALVQAALGAASPMRAPVCGSGGGCWSESSVEVPLVLEYMGFPFREADCELPLSPYSWEACSYGNAVRVELLEGLEGEVARVWVEKSRTVLMERLEAAVHTGAAAADSVLTGTGQNMSSLLGSLSCDEDSELPDLFWVFFQWMEGLIYRNGLEGMPWARFDWVQLRAH